MAEGGFRSFYSDSNQRTHVDQDSTCTLRDGSMRRESLLRIPQENCVKGVTRQDMHGACSPSSELCSFDGSPPSSPHDMVLEPSKLLDTPVDSFDGFVFGTQEFDGSPHESDEEAAGAAVSEVPTYCPCCQVGLSIFDVALAEQHVDECIATFVSPALPCPKGGECDFTSPRHFLSFSHDALAVARSGKRQTQPAPLSMIGSRTIDTFFSRVQKPRGGGREPARQKQPHRPSRPKSGKSTSGQWMNSTGQKRECPFYKRIPTTSITVDAFQYGAVSNCSAYFLTHFHTDHYGGLTSKFKGNVYCSEGTAALVAGFLKLPRSQIYPLPMETPTMVAEAECTLLDANHCPGAVMIRFKLRDGRVILHTGDFRATNAMPMHALLRDASVHTIYLDTTYLNPKYCFPLQDECIRKVVTETRRYLLDKPNALILVGTYSLGKERVYLALADALGCKACVDRRKLSMMKMVAPEALPKLTLDGSSTRLHVVPLSTLSKVKISKYTSERTRGLPFYRGIIAWRPTGWTHGGRPGSGTGKIGGDVVIRGVDYSEHSSFTELRDFVQALQPTKIIPTVNNGSSDRRAEMATAFRTWLGRSV